MTFTAEQIYKLLRAKGEPMRAIDIYEALDLPPKDHYAEIMLYGRLRGMTKRKKWPIHKGTDAEGYVVYSAFHMKQNELVTETIQIAA